MFAAWGGAKPLLEVAFKAALAATLAWMIVLPFDGAAERYAYYAPLGAVVVVSSRLSHTVQSSVQTVLAIAIGTSLALLARYLPGPGVLALAVVVGLGTVVGAWHVLGSMSSWVPIAGLFTLVVGGADAEEYMLAYLALTGLGAMIGVAVNVVAPPLPLAATGDVQQALREMVADRLDGLADGLDADELPNAEAWTDGGTAVESDRQRADELIARTLELSRVNWRARRHRDAAERQARQGQALGHLAFLVDEMAELLAHEEAAQLERVALGPQLRSYAAEAFRRSADLVRSIEAAQADAELLEQARRATDELAAAIHRQPEDDTDDWFVAGNLVVALRRLQASLTLPEG